MIIQFPDPLNVSVQVGDLAWWMFTTQQGVAGNQYDTSSMNDAFLIGEIDQVTIDTISVTNVINPPLGGAFIMFSKSDEANKGDLLGYYAKLKMTNASTEKIELFAVSSEIAQSSK